MVNKAAEGMRFLSPRPMRTQPGPLVDRLLACWRLPLSQATPHRCQTACRQPSAIQRTSIVIVDPLP